MPIPRSPAILIANIGSGGEAYGLGGVQQVHVDLVLRRLIERRAIAGDIQQLPLRAAVADVVVCVGSVLNHCDPKRAINELARILRPGGHIILEFDSSDGLHHLRTGLRHAPSVRINTFYNRRMVILREYSLAYISSILLSAGIHLCRQRSFHIGSAAALAIGLPPIVAAPLSAVDSIAQFVPRFRMSGSNIILLGQRR